MKTIKVTIGLKAENTGEALKLGVRLKKWAKRQKLPTCQTTIVEHGVSIDEFFKRRSNMGFSYETRVGNQFYLVGNITAGDIHIDLFSVYSDVRILPDVALGSRITQKDVKKRGGGKMSKGKKIFPLLIIKDESKDTAFAYVNRGHVIVALQMIQIYLCKDDTKQGKLAKDEIDKMLIELRGWV